MKNILTRQFFHELLLVLGLVLMAGGIITGKPGASVIGLIIAAVNTQQWIQLNRKEKNKKQG